MQNKGNYDQKLAISDMARLERGLTIKNKIVETNIKLIYNEVKHIFIYKY